MSSVTRRCRSCSHECHRHVSSEPRSGSWLLAKRSQMPPAPNKKYRTSSLSTAASGCQDVDEAGVAAFVEWAGHLDAPALDKCVRELCDSIMQGRPGDELLAFQLTWKAKWVWFGFNEMGERGNHRPGGKLCTRDEVHHSPPSPFDRSSSLRLRGPQEEVPEYRAITG